MSRRAGRSEGEAYSAARVGQRPSTDRWAMTRDWSMVLSGGPRDGQIRRTTGQIYRYDYVTTRAPDGPVMSDVYLPVGFAPYQRVAFMRYDRTEEMRNIAVLTPTTRKKWATVSIDGVIS